MKLHQLGAWVNISLNTLSHAHADSYENHVSHSHISARIADDELLLKLESRILLRHSEDFD